MNKIISNLIKKSVQLTEFYLFIYLSINLFIYLKIIGKGKNPKVLLLFIDLFYFLIDYQ